MLLSSSSHSVMLCMSVRAKHHEHIPTLTLKERELERLKREQERKEGGLTGA